MMKIVLKQGTDGWKTAADTLGLKNSKEAIFEFLRIEDRTILQAQKYLLDYASDLAHEIEPSISKLSEAKYSEMAPFDQVD